MPKLELSSVFIGRKIIIENSFWCRDRVEHYFDRHPRTSHISLKSVAQLFGPVMAVMALDKGTANDQLRHDLAYRCHGWVTYHLRATHPQVIEACKDGGDQVAFDALMRNPETAHALMAYTYAQLIFNSGDKHALRYAARALMELQVAHEVFGHKVFKWSDSVTKIRIQRALFG